MRALFLIGFRGCGKTTLGGLLAKKLGWGFLDLDQEWERRRGCSIVSFVERAGIEAFRREEEAQIREVLWHLERTGDQLVVAMGGGFVEWPPSLELLEASPFPRIYLEVPAEALWARLAGDVERRKIGQLSDSHALAALWEARRPFYEKIATYRVGNRDINDSLIELEHLAQRP